MATQSAPATPSISFASEFMSSTETEDSDNSWKDGGGNEACSRAKVKNLEAKVVMLGSQGVGKTSVLIRYTGHIFSNAISPTIGASFFTTKLQIDNYRVRLQVWDTAGQERFRAMAPMYYRKANAAILVFDVTKQSSFNDMKSWIEELQRNSEGHLVICILGNKTDLEPLREVAARTASEYAETIGALLFETSALANVGIQDAFAAISRALISYAETSPKGNVLLKDKGNCPSCDNTLDVSHLHAKDMVTEETTGPCSGCT